MTLPNRHLPGQTTLGGRRVTQRQFLLQNDEDDWTKENLGYIFALNLKKHDQSPHAFMMMSNHYHICMTDNTGKRADFYRDAHHMTAKVINQKRQRRESLWNSSPPGNTLLLDSEAVADAMVYIWLNPVEAGLVSKVEDWEHLKILPRHWGKSMRFARSEGYSAKGENKKYPEFIEITPMPPAMFDHLPLEDVIVYFEKRIAEGEARIACEREKANKGKPMGMKKCYEQSPFGTPKKSVPMGSLNPRFASTIVEAVQLAIAGMKSFWRQYKKRLEGFRRGSKAKFPAGTVAMRARFGVKCETLGRGDPHVPIYAPFQIT